MLKLKNNTVILIGDCCNDEYIYGNVTRLSPEAPVPVFAPTHTDTKAGMGGNVYNNLCNLNINVIAYLPEVKSTKTRYIDSNSGQHFLRVDNDQIAYRFDTNLLTTTADAVIISDYNKGYITQDVLDAVQHKYHNTPIFIDTKKTDLSFINDNCYVKINELEYSKLQSHPKNLIVTRGSKSVTYNNQEFAVPHIPVFDVTGAGDTFLASLAYGYLQTKSIESAMQYAIFASSVTVQHVGVYAPTLEEINNAINRNS